MTLDKMNLNSKILDLKAQIQEKEKQIKVKEQYNLNLKNLVNNLNSTIEALRDPNGLLGFRRMLSQFNNDIECIQNEKETQYRTMNQVVKIMEGMNDSKNEQDVKRERELNEAKQQVQQMKKK